MTTPTKTKDQQIVFQNQSHLVQKYFENCGLCGKLKDICLGTDLMVRYATEGYSKELAGRFDAYEQYIYETYVKPELEKNKEKDD